MPRGAMYVSAWVATTAAATVVGLGAVGFVRAASGDVVAQSLSEQEVRAQLAQVEATSATASASPSPAAPSPLASPSPSVTSPSTRASAPPSQRPSPSSRPAASGTARPPTTAVRTGFTSAGGSVVAQCTSSTVYLVSWSPSAGYQMGEVQRGPGTKAAVRFEAEGHHEVRIEVRCSGGRPVASIESEDHH